MQEIHSLWLDKYLAMTTCSQLEEHLKSFTLVSSSSYFLMELFEAVEAIKDGQTHQTLLLLSVIVHLSHYLPEQKLVPFLNNFDYHSICQKGIAKDAPPSQMLAAKRLSNYLQAYAQCRNLLDILQLLLGDSSQYVALSSSNSQLAGFTLNRLIRTVQAILTECIENVNAGKRPNGSSYNYRLDPRERVGPREGARKGVSYTVFTELSSLSNTDYEAFQSQFLRLCACCRKVKNLKTLALKKVTPFSEELNKVIKAQSIRRGLEFQSNTSYLSVQDSQVFKDKQDQKQPIHLVNTKKSNKGPEEHKPAHSRMGRKGLLASLSSDEDSQDENVIAKQSKIAQPESQCHDSQIQLPEQKSETNNCQATGLIDELSSNCKKINSLIDALFV